MITGAHAILYSRKPDEDRAFFRDVLKLPNVDVADGWLIFGLPPSEVAVHPADQSGGDGKAFVLLVPPHAAPALELLRQDPVSAPSAHELAVVQKRVPAGEVDRARSRPVLCGDRHGAPRY